MYLGCGDPFIGFCPYFLQVQSSGGISGCLLLTAGTRAIFLILSFLYKNIYEEEDRKILKQELFAAN